MRTTPEITADSPFGVALAEQVRKANGLIVEIGTGCALGSTAVIAANLCRNSYSYFVTMEGDREQAKIAHNNLPANASLGIGLVSRAIKPFYHPDHNPEFRKMWNHEFELITRSPFQTIHSKIDLLLLDGGEFTTDGDFLTLWDRCRVIALDDCNPAKSVKTIYAKTCLELAGWTNLAGSDNDRNGWVIFERP